MIGASETSRRDFLKLLGIGGSGRVLGLPLGGCASSTNPAAVEGAYTPSVWLQVTADNRIHFYQPYNEMGQGTDTGITTLVAEELNVAAESITVHHAGVDPAFKNPEFGLQTTGGSTSIKASYLAVRQLGADTRETLRRAAAQQLGLDVGDINMQDGYVVWPGGKQPYGDFAELAANLKPAHDTPLKQPGEFSQIGQPRVRLDAAAKSTGTAVYGIDIEIPNLHYAVLVRCPVFGGTVQGFDASAAQGMPGVVKVLEIYNGVAVVARSYWQARQAAAKLQVDWNTPNKLARFSSADAQAMFSAALNSEDGRRAKHSGDGAKGIEAAAKIIEAKYWAPYLAHATMEPMNCTVRIENGVCDVWTGNQSMQIAAGLAALHGGVHRDAVTVHACYLGGGFGRRLVSDYVAETAAIAKASGLPVQLLWSREDDMQNDCYRPASLVRYTAGIDAAGELTTWTATRVGANLMPGTLDEAVDVLLPEFVPEGMADWISKRGYGVYAGMLVDPASIEGLVADYAVENSEVRHITLDPGLRVGWWRSVGHSYSGFFKESFIDEIAHASGTDPLQWRIDHTAENPRLRNTLQLAAQAANWGKPLAAGRFQGIASHTSFNTMVTQIAEISVANNQIKVHKVVCAVDCGVAVNPQIVRAQIESAVIFGITAALYGEITIVEGVVQQSNFHDYQALRMMEAPEIEVIIVPSSESPTGIGEPGLPPIAGAMGNGVFAATGQRLRSLPLRIS